MIVETAQAISMELASSVRAGFEDRDVARDWDPPPGLSTLAVGVSLLSGASERSVTQPPATAGMMSTTSFSTTAVARSSR
ncbi:hypothetical protein Sinac_6667 [Singulisphaera acidiphila DSM 18658]|uniref:Uncharacterized protein n=1 Tax=Singulisphaera acidiphila (strain ATCC BAA-1392 / DSM 18658 / VKM B-2454 / MOB10) TaxID=886293 RepID=L0DPX2_SINAD|nr:hypothetical protein Sinac_6667 [Singulisphaera acidiphila DSM 18658]